MNIAEYLDLRQRLADLDYGHEYDWAQNLKRPDNAEQFAGEYIWVVLNSGMKNQVAQKIADRIWDAFRTGRTAASVFRHPGKAAAIDDFWERRAERFAEFRQVDDVVAYCRGLPWIGKITCWHLAKNWGEDVAKPDRWLVRVADKAGETVTDLCARLSHETGDRVATVDLVIWRGCNLGLVRT